MCHLVEWILCLAREDTVEEIHTETHKDWAWRNQRKNPDPRVLQCFRSHRETRTEGVNIQLGPYVPAERTDKWETRNICPQILPDPSLLYAQC